MNLSVQPRSDLRWRRGNQAALLVLGIAALAGVCLQAHHQQVGGGDSFPTDGALERLTTEKIDPNTASAASMMRLPGVGSVRAAAIVAWREAPGHAPFHSAADLSAVPGIGPITASRAAPHLTLPAGGADPYEEPEAP